jgi:hypothetical protein
MYSIYTDYFNKKKYMGFKSYPVSLENEYSEVALTRIVWECKKQRMLNYTNYQLNRILCDLEKIFSIIII